MLLIPCIQDGGMASLITESASEALLGVFGIRDIR